jgi:hypothetical protein
VEQEKSRISLTMPKVKRVKRLQSLKQEIQTLQQEAGKIKYRIRRLRIEERRINAVQGQGQGRAIHYTTRCSSQGCNGYVCAEENGHCPACEKITCMDCMQLLKKENGDDHICNDDDRLSAQTIRSNTTQCPKCHIPIEKSEGCDQMFCVVCFTAFSYRTGLEERGEVHNPHMYEIQRRLGIYTDLRALTPFRNIGDVPCGGFPTLQELTEKLSRYHPNLRMYSRRLDILRTIAQVEIRRWRPKQGDLCEDLRIRLILKKISEKRFVMQVGRRHIDNVIKVHFTQILEAFLAASQDVLLRLLQEEEPQFAPPPPPPAPPTHDQGDPVAPNPNTDADDPTRYFALSESESESESAFESWSEDDDDVIFLSQPVMPVRFDDRVYVSELDQIIDFTNEALRSTAIRYGRTFPHIPTMYHGINVLRIQQMHPTKNTYL